jgi:hypothetical protein
MSFKEWLSSQKERNDPIGDFAKDSQGIMPDIETMQELETHLADNAACREAIVAGKEAFLEYTHNIKEAYNG